MSGGEKIAHGNLTVSTMTRHRGGVAISLSDTHSRRRCDIWDKNPRQLCNEKLEFLVQRYTSVEDNGPWYSIMSSIIR